MDLLDVSVVHHYVPAVLHMVHRKCDPSLRWLLAEAPAEVAGIRPGAARSGSGVGHGAIGPSRRNPPTLRYTFSLSATATFLKQFFGVEAALPGGSATPGPSACSCAVRSKPTQLPSPLDLPCLISCPNVMVLACCFASTCMCRKLLPKCQHSTTSVMKARRLFS